MYISLLTTKIACVKTLVGCTHIFIYRLRWTYEECLVAWSLKSCCISDLILRKTKQRCLFPPGFNRVRVLGERDNYRHNNSIVFIYYVYGDNHYTTGTQFCFDMMWRHLSQHGFVEQVGTLFSCIYFCMNIFNLRCANHMTSYVADL